MTTLKVHEITKLIEVAGRSGIETLEIEGIKLKFYNQFQAPSKSSSSNFEEIQVGTSIQEDMATLSKEQEMETLHLDNPLEYERLLGMASLPEFGDDNGI
jgi:hypothetical protein